MTRAGDTVAVEDAAGRRLTYDELRREAARAARRLAARGVTRGDRVATTLPASLDFAVLLHAVPRLGAALVPLDHRLTGGERRWQLDDCGARLVVEGPLGGPEAEIPRPDGPPDPGAAHTVLYTSGTTGTPKRVVLTLANHRASAVASAWNLGVFPGDRWLCCLPVHHVGGLAILLRSALYGTAAVLHPRFDADAVASALKDGAVTLVSLVATMLRRLAAGGLEAAPGLRAALVGGGPVPRDLLDWGAERGLPLVQTYGMTETASQVASASLAEALEHRGAAGRPLPGVEMRIGEGGEIQVRGAMVSAGAAGPDGWLRTGDRGHLDAGGRVWVEGRIADTIVTGGENVSAVEVEEALLAHPAVADAAVVGRADPEWGEAVTAFVVEARPLADEELLAFARERLAPYKVPKALRRVEELPRTANGKLRRHALPPDS